MPAAARSDGSAPSAKAKATSPALAVALPRVSPSLQPARVAFTPGEASPLRTVPASADSTDPVAESVRSAEVPPNAVSAPGGPVGWITGGGLLAVWCVGFLAVALPTLMGLFANQWRRRQARRVTATDWSALFEELCRTFSIHRAVELRQGRASTIPLTWGVIRPVVLLPEGAHGWTDTMRRHVLLHELAHVQRFDAGFQLAGRIAGALYWFHPLAWFALYRLRLECEQACDDCVVQAGECPTEYARQLLDLVRWVRIPRFSMAVAMARTNALERRMMALFDDTRSHMPLGRQSGRRLWAVSAMIVLGLATVQPRPAAVGADNPPAVTTPSSDGPPAPSEASTTSAIQPAGRISGRVVNNMGGDGVQGAEVILLSPPPKGRNVYIGKLPPAPTATDAQGEFSFDWLGPGRYRIWANHGKLTTRHARAGARRSSFPNRMKRPKAVLLRLVAGVSITTRVRDKATGKPIPNATVHLGWSDFPVDATTDRNGLVVLQPLTLERWLVEAWADGFATESRWMNLESGSDADAEFLLGPGGSLEGVVRDGRGKPVAGAGVSAFVEGRGGQIAFVESDENGRYRLGHLPVDVALRIYLWKTDYGDKNVLAKVTPAKEPLNVTLETRPHGGSIAGVVVDRTGRPIAGAELVNIGPNSNDVRKTETGADGRFILENLHEQRHFGKEVLVRAKGAAPKRQKVVTGPPGKPAEVTIILDPGHRVSGRVTDDKDHPLEDVSVYFDHGNDPFADGSRGTTDKEGRFAFDALPPNCPFTFSKAGYSRIENCSLPLDTDQVITVKMDPAGIIIGKVVDSKTNQPVPRPINVRLIYSPKRQPGEPSTALRSDLVEPGQTCQSNDGRFKLGNLVVGMPLQVTLLAEGYERYVAERVVVAHPDERGHRGISARSARPRRAADLRGSAARLEGECGRGSPATPDRGEASPNQPARRLSL